MSTWLVIYLTGVAVALGYEAELSHHADFDLAQAAFCVLAWPLVLLLRCVDVAMTPLRGSQETNADAGASAKATADHPLVPDNHDDRGRSEPPRRAAGRGND